MTYPDFRTIKPTKKQYEAWQKWLDPNTLYVLFGGAAGGGKTWFICEKQITQAYQYPGIKMFIARKQLKRLMASTFITFNKVCTFHGIPRDDWYLDGKYNYIQFKNGSRIDLLDVDYQPSDPMFERLGSLEFTNGDIEEAGEIKEAAFDILKSRVGRHRNTEFNLPPKIGLTCNPTKNFLYATFYKPWKQGILPKEYAFVQALFNDNPFVSEEYGKALAQLSDIQTRQRLMMGNWEYADDPAALMSYDAILDMWTNSVPSGPRHLTCDVARYGGDKIVIYLWEGNRIVKVWVYQYQGLDQTTAMLKLIAQEEGVPYSFTIADDDGMGGGVVDNMRGIKGFVANSSPIEVNYKKPNFQNLKSQCTYRMAEVVNNRAIAISVVQFKTNIPGYTESKWKEQLIEEMEQVKSKDMDKDTKLRIVPKEDIKELLGRSPDLSDTIMMKMYFDFDKPHTQQRAVQFYPHLRK